MSETLDRLRRTAEENQNYRELLRVLAETARAEGCTWEQIGSALGVSRQAAQQMYGRVRVIEGDK